MTQSRENDDERLARRWLIEQGHRDVRRPISDPPDFVVDGIHAVEVTRLSQQVVVADANRSISEEQVRMPLERQIARALHELGPPANPGRSWVLDCEYDPTQPLPPKRTLRRQISKALQPLLTAYDDDTISDMHAKHLDYDRHAGEVPHLRFPHLCLECGVCLELAEVSHDPARFFLQNVGDREGLALAAALTQSVQARVRAKSDTVRKQRRVGEYASWWLVLVDHVAVIPMQALSERELASVRDQDFDFWSRVTVIASRGDWHFDLRSSMKDA